MARVFFHRQKEARALAGHPWVYRSEIERIEGETAAGDVFEMDLTWQAVPKTPETADIGPRMGLMPETEGG